MPNLISTLDTGWEVAERVPAGRDLLFRTGGEKTWLPAAVPGHVHSDLMRAGMISDPFFRLNERGVRWVDEADWTYRTTFTVDSERLAARGASGRHFLLFHGLDTLARVYLNGALIGETASFFVPFRFDVTDLLRVGENDLRVEFDSALRVGQERAAAYLGDGTSTRGKQSYFNFGPRAFIRKPQYMFGWDWGPELVSCGIWQPVELLTVTEAEIVDWRMEYTFTDPATVDIRLQITVEKYAAGPLTVGAALYAPGDNTPSASLPEEAGRHTVSLLIRNQKVARWHPNDLDASDPINVRFPKVGLQKRYLLNLKVWRTDDEGETEVVAHKGVSIGFRTVELIQEPDADGKGAGFKFRINGVDTFIKGANWIPDHSFPSAITRQQLRQRLTQARDAGMNMLRIWGGGLYESEDFYNLCDELGLLVWQDFGFACSMYPDDLPDFTENVRAEATANVRRLRHRASLALWCGGNENLELFQNRWDGATQATKFYGDRLIHELLPDVLAQEDTQTPYLPNSPYGGENCTSEDFGDSHYWNVWHAKTPDSDGDWVHYAKSVTRFSSEFGFASSCGMAAWEMCLAPEDRTPRSLAVQAHDKTRKGYEKFLSYIEKHFPTVETLDDLVYYGQANQAMALQFGVEHWRRLKGRCWGTLFWQLNDCWPTQSWSVIDSTGEPKAAYYAAKRFYAPLLLSLVREGNTVEAFLVNDSQMEIAGYLEVRLLTFDGKEVGFQVTEMTVPANAAPVRIGLFDLPEAQQNVVLHATFQGEDKTPLAENVLLLAEPKELALPDDPGIVMEAVEASGATTSPGAAALVLRAERFAAFVRLEFEGVASTPMPALSDNWFHLLPGETRTVKVTGLPSDYNERQRVLEHLRLRHL